MQVTVTPTAVHLQPVPAALTKVSPLGSVSLITTPVPESEGPALWTPMV